MEWILGAFGGPNYHHLTLGCTSSQYRSSHNLAGVSAQPRRLGKNASEEMTFHRIVVKPGDVTYDTANSIVYNNEQE